jgi:hypothetical protein
MTGKTKTKMKTRMKRRKKMKTQMKLEPEKEVMSKNQLIQTRVAQKTLNLNQEERLKWLMMNLKDWKK